MTGHDLVEQLLELPGVEMQKRFLEAHRSRLDNDLAGALKAQADHFLRSDIQRALVMVELLYCLAGLSGDPAHRALGLRAEGNICLIGQGRYQEAVELYDQAAQIYQDQGRPVDRAKARVGKIEALCQLGRYDEALQVGREISQILREHGELQTLASVTLSLGTVQGRAGDYAGALAVYDQAAALCRELEEDNGSPWLSLWVQQNRAIALLRLGRFDESIEASRAAWEGLEQLGQGIEAARSRQTMAFAYFLQGRYNEALDHFNHVQDVFLADGRRREAMGVELDISDCLLQLCRFDDVLEKCRRVRSLFAELGTKRLVAQAIVNEAAAFAALDRYPEALASLAEARQIHKSEGNTTCAAMVDLEMAAVLLRQGRHAESLGAALACATVFETIGRPIEGAQTRLIGARAAFAMDRLDVAISLARQALGAGEAMNVPTLIYQGHQILGELAAARGDRQEALAAYDQAIGAVERLRGRLMVEYRVGFLEDKEEIYQDVVGLCLDLGQPQRGLEYAERAKSRALLDLLAFRLDLGLQARNKQDQPLVDDLVRLRTERDLLYRAWETEGESGERGWTTADGSRDRVQQDILSLEKEITSLWHRLLISNADYAREASLWNVRTEPVQPYLAGDELLIEFFEVRGRLIAFLVTADSIEVRRLEGTLAQVQRLMQLLWLNLKAVPKSAPDRLSGLTANAQGVLKRLDDLLVVPLTADLDSFARLIVVPHGPLHYLPFHALYDGTSYRLERHEVSYLPGASFLRYCREAQVAGFGLVAFGHSLGGRLPHTAQEARQVAALFGGQVFLEDEATLVEFQQTAPQCRALHLAAHGDFRPDNPLFSGLALADGWLTTLDIFGLRLHASLVTLSACQTGRNVVGGGDELLGLMRAFLSAGAASLILTCWAVEDRSTACLMERFYRNLAAGRTKGQALRRAQLQFLQGPDGLETKGYSHPYFWAPFFLVGSAGAL